MTNPCISTVTDKILVFSDKKSKSEFRIINQNQRQIEKHKVDDCLIKDKELKKCDWLTIDMESKKEIYIELKGKDIPQAIEQICTSIEKLTQDRKARKLGFIIATRSPQDSTEIHINAKKVFKTHQLLLVVKTIQHSEKIEKLIEDLSK